MSPTGSQHATCVNRIVNKFFKRYAVQTAILRVQKPIRLDSYSEPEPDFHFLQWRDDFTQQHTRCLPMYYC